MKTDPYFFNHSYHHPYVGNISHTNTFRGFHLHANGDYCEITLVLGGRIRHILNGSTHIMERGDVTFLLPKDVHQYIDEGEDAEILNFSFVSDAISHSVWQTLNIERFPICCTLKEETVMAILGTISSFFEEGHKKVFLREGAITETMLGWLAYRIHASGNIAPTEPSPIRLAVLYIQDNFRTPLTEAEVAEQVHFSCSRFSTLFKHEMGVTFRTYLRDLRLQYAYMLLHIPTYTVAKAREESGFESPEYFSRAFRSHFGIAPSEVAKL